MYQDCILQVTAASDRQLSIQDGILLRNATCMHARMGTGASKRRDQPYQSRRCIHCPYNCHS